MGTTAVALAVLVIMGVAGVLLPDMPTGIGGYMALPSANAVTATQVPAERPALRSLSARDGWDPIVTYDPATKIVTLTDHLAADALLCITYAQGRAPDCRLPIEWIDAGRRVIVRPGRQP